MPVYPVIIQPYSPEWPKWAYEKAQQLKEGLNSNLAAVEHVGSTAIPGLAAKPIIDLMPVVYQLDTLDQQRPILESFGYEWYGEYRIAQRRFCVLPGPTGDPVVHLHFFPLTSADIDRHVAFRDYLRAHPNLAQAYQSEKLRAARLRPFDAQAYHSEKAGWIQQHEIQELDWYTRNHYH
ncbi:GrpB family protein [Spirosoma knui]